MSVADKLLSELNNFHKTVEENTKLKNILKTMKISKKMNRTVFRYQKILNEFNLFEGSNKG